MWEEYGDIKLNLLYRMRVHSLMERLCDMEYVKEQCPGVRSLLISFDPDVVHLRDLWRNCASSKAVAS